MKRFDPAFELSLLALSLLATTPLWVVDVLPIQDLPQHVAAVRVFHDYGDPSLAFSRYFEIDLSRTQYLAYYLGAHLLSYVFGVELANRILLTCAVGLTPYAMRALLRALGRDERYALMTVPLAWNAHLVLGFLNFVAAIPLALYGLSLAAGLRLRYRGATAVGLALVALVTFYTHVVPFAFLGLGAAMLALSLDPVASFGRLLPLAPSGVAALVWTQISPAGRSTLVAAHVDDAAGGGPQPTFAPWIESFRELPSWLTDVLHGELDDHVLILYGVTFLFALSTGTPALAKRNLESPNDVLRARLLRRVTVLSPIALLAYFVTPTSFDWIWPINARFPLLAALFALPALPRPTGLRAAAIHGAAAALALVSSVAVARAFITFEADDVGDLVAASDAIPPGARVAALVFDRGSSAVKFSPFLHLGAFHQARRGGAAVFTFADFPQSPVRFRDDARPPPVGPRWEWMPERVDPQRDLGWFDYVLVRGGPGAIARARETFEPVFESGLYHVYARRR